MTAMKRRLDQWLANLGYCSRREAKVFLRTHEVTVNDVRVDDPGTKAEAAAVWVDGAPLDHADGLVLVMNKPPGRVCSHDEREGPLVYELLPERWRARHPQVTSVGRLDKDTSGVIVLTDRTELVHRYTSPRHKVPKVYRVEVDGDLPDGLEAVFTAGTLQLDGEKAPCAPAEYRRLGPRVAELVLIEGKYHQVKRMMVAAAGLTVVRLHRERFGALTDAGLAPGEYRVTTEAEIEGR